jgi:hypothetical protein
LNFLELLRAGHTDHVINGQALAYRRRPTLTARRFAPVAE